MIRYNQKWPGHTRPWHFLDICWHFWTHVKGRNENLIKTRQEFWCPNVNMQHHLPTLAQERWADDMDLFTSRSDNCILENLLHTRNETPELKTLSMATLISLCKEKARHSSCMCSSHYVAEIKTLLLHECDWNHFRDFNLAKLIIVIKCYDSLLLGGCIARNACMCSTPQRTGLSVRQDLKIWLKPAQANRMQWSQGENHVSWKHFSSHITFVWTSACQLLHRVGRNENYLYG